VPPEAQPAVSVIYIWVAFVAERESVTLVELVVAASLLILIVGEVGAVLSWMMVSETQAVSFPAASLNFA
jgi:hypothetical protein